MGDIGLAISSQLYCEQTDANMARYLVQEKTHYNFTLFGDNNNVDEDGMGSIPKPPMGRFSTYQAMISHIKAKKFFGWHHYEKIV
jgi:hypothetical protein